MKKIVVREQWCLGCHLCEYFCAFANSGMDNMVKALQDKKINPRIIVEGDNQISFAVNCRHCDNPVCVAGCIAGALRKEPDGAVMIDQDKCVGCGTCILPVHLVLIRFAVFIIFFLIFILVFILVFILAVLVLLLLLLLLLLLQST